MCVCVRERERESFSDIVVSTSDCHSRGLGFDPRLFLQGPGSSSGWTVRVRSRYRRCGVFSTHHGVQTGFGSTQSPIK